MGTRDKDRSRALTAKTTNFLMIDPDNFLKIPSNENIMYSSLWKGEQHKVMINLHICQVKKKTKSF